MEIPSSGGARNYGDASEDTGEWMGLGSTVIFALKRNEAKQKRNVFAVMRKKFFFACFRI
jgi:hypothetical protein